MSKKRKKNLNRQKGRQASYIRLKDFRPEEILPFTGLNKEPMEVTAQGTTYKVKMSSARYGCFRKSLSCAKCGITGSKMILELPPNQERPHFNLYAVDEDGQLILMTKDHIVPKSRGGSNSLKNLQTMCTICNGEKADKI